jgi:NADH:ubiquinone oxidoreductase subunit 2 (subunit N)
MKKVSAFIASISALALPIIVSAQATQVNNLSQAGSFIINTINNIIVPVLFAIAFIVFLWGAFQTFIMGASSEETKDKGKALMLWSLIGFFVMISIWGLVGILTGTVGFGNNGAAPTNLPKANVTL